MGSASEKTTNSQKPERAPGIVGLVLVAAVVYLIVSVHSTLKQFGNTSDILGPWFIPWVSVAGITVGSVLLLLRRNAWQGEDHSSDDTGSLRKPDIWIGLASLLIYVWAMEYLGFYVDSALLIVEFIFLFKLRVRTAIAVGIGMELFAYILFVRLLNILLPAWPVARL